MLCSKAVLSRTVSFFGAVTATSAPTTTTTSTSTVLTTRSDSTRVSIMGSAASSSLFGHHTRTLLKDVRRGDRGDSRRLSFAEKSERREGKGREQKKELEALRLEAENYVEQEFPESLEAIFMISLRRCTMIANKVVNMAKCLEALDVEVATGRKISLSQTAEVVKTSSTELEVTVSNQAFTTPVFQRIVKFDNTLRAARDGNKITLTIPQMTKQRREKASGEISQTVAEFKAKVKAAKTKGTKLIQSFGLEDEVTKMHITDMDAKADELMEEKVQELEEVAESVMSAELDESDASL